MNMIDDSECIIMKETITNEDFKELIELEKLCKKEGINLKLELEYKLAMTEDNDLKKHHRSCKKEYFYYSHGKLISYLGICSFGGSIYELNGMTHPDYRRSGIFHRLYVHALAECKNAGKKNLLLLTDGISDSGNKFIEYVGGVPAFSEHRMELWAAEFSSKDFPDLKETVSLREITENNTKDKELVRTLDRILYNEPDEDMEEDSWHTMKNTYLIEKDGITLGKIRMDYQDGEAFLYGFGILPKYRGKGYGKSALRAILLDIFSKGASKAALDVETKNDRALGIYTGNGFKTVSCMRYYEVEV